MIDAKTANNYSDLDSNTAGLSWGAVKPSGPGMYIYRKEHEWVHRLVHIKEGSWHSGQNPEWLYANDKPLDRVEMGRWFGPIPNSNESD